MAGGYATAASPPLGPAPDSAVPACVAEDILRMNDGLRLILVNELAQADTHFATAVEEAAKRTPNFEASEHDRRGAFAFVGSLAALLRGLATLENNQLGDALERLKRADELIDMDAPWAGKTVLKGLCVLLSGVVQTMQGNLTRGVWHMLRSWLWLRNLEAEALVYDGPERDLVRSSALISLGAFGLVVSLLPPYLTRTASWLSGFSAERDDALGLLRRCWKEEGVLAPFAALVLIGYLVDIRTFIGESASEEAFAEADQMLSWADQRYPNSIFFEGLRANRAAVGRDVQLAMDISDHMAAASEELQALKLVIHGRRASYAQANLEWSRAAASFKDALQVHVDVQRRSMCPAMAVNAALCYELDGQPEKRDEMLDVALEYRDRQDKKDWGVADRWAFGLADAAKAGEWEPQLELFQLMTVKHRSTLFMPPAKVEAFVALLREASARCRGNADEECRCLFLEAEVLRQNSDFKAALEVCERGLAMKPALGQPALKGGYIPFMHFVSASCFYYTGDLTAAKESLKKLDASSKDHDLYKSVSFKAAQLNRRLGVGLKDAYLEVAVGARKKICLTAQVPSSTSTVTWDFVLEEYTINLVARFQPDNDETVVELQRLENYAAASGPASGSYDLNGAGGTLTLTFDNTFSMLRGKQLLCRLQPDELPLSVA